MASGLDETYLPRLGEVVGESAASVDRSWGVGLEQSLVTQLWEQAVLSGVGARVEVSSPLPWLREGDRISS